MLGLVYNSSKLVECFSIESRGQRRFLDMKMELQEEFSGVVNAAKEHLKKKDFQVGTVNLC